MADPRIPLKNPWLAGVLAFLMPGAGHLYQGRLFKAAVFSVCILGLFFTGMAMAGWQAVQPPPKETHRDNIALLKYAAQMGVGLPAMYGLVQRERYYKPSNVPVSEISGPLTAPFRGVVVARQAAGGELEEHVSGTLTLRPAEEQLGKRMITGTLETSLNGQPVTLQLSNRVQLEKPISADKQREVDSAIVEVRDGREQTVGRMYGTIPRSFADWFQAPMDDEQERDLHRRLGKVHELAMVFTWVAGLLNLLAVWDAVEGPALGYGDEQPEPAA